MSKAEYAMLQDVIMDADFPDLDLALRRGRHIDRDDAAWYSLLTDGQEQLEPFYRRYGCELIHKTDGYFYLLPTADKVSRKQLAATDMLVGQALALLYLDPAALERGGVVSQEEVVSQLSAVLGSDALIGVFSPGKRKVKDERIAQRNVRQRVAEAVRRLAGLGFVELSDENALRLRAALMRFAEPVRGLSEPAEALAKLVAQGEVALTSDDAADGAQASDDADESHESADAEPSSDELEPPTRVVAAKGAHAAAVRSDRAADGGGGADAVSADADGEDEDISSEAAQDAAYGREIPSLAVELEGSPSEPHASAVGAAAEAEVVRRGVASERPLPREHAGELAPRDSAAAGGRVDPAVGDVFADGDGQLEGVREFPVDEPVDARSAAERGDEAAWSAGLDEAGAEGRAGIRRGDTLAGLGAPRAADDAPGRAAGHAADGGGERSAVVRKPRAPVVDDDLDWADIVLPDPDPDPDAEDGS